MIDLSTRQREGLIAMTITLTKVTAPCSVCLTPTTPPSSIEVDPLCASCTFDLNARLTFLPINTLHDLAPNFTIMIDPDLR